MPVVIDYTLCDGVAGCPAVQICDAGALHFNAEAQRVEYEKGDCRDCGTCVNYCAPGAVMHAATEEEWQELWALMQS